jgi:amidase
VSFPANVHYLTIAEIAPLIADGKLSPVDLTETMLARIEALEPRLNAYAKVTADLARQQARQAADEIAAGRYRGALHGVPIAVKDLVYTKGFRTMGGSAVFLDFVPGFDATVVQKLAEAGAVLLGKLNMTEGRWAAITQSLRFRRTPGVRRTGLGRPPVARDRPRRQAWRSRR